MGKAAKAGYRWKGRSAATPGRMHRFLRNASANSQLPNGPAEPPAPTELRRIRTALQSSTARLIYRTHSNATICNSSCTVTGGAYHSARRVSPCVRNGYKTGASLNCTRSTHQTVPQRPFSPSSFPARRKRRGRRRLVGNGLDGTSLRCSRSLFSCLVQEKKRKIMSIIIDIRKLLC